MKNKEKQEVKKQILSRLMELKAQDKMNRFVFKNLSKNPKDEQINKVLDWANAIKKEREALEKALEKLDGI